MQRGTRTRKPLSSRQTTKMLTWLMMPTLVTPSLRTRTVNKPSIRLTMGPSRLSRSQSSKLWAKVPKFMTSSSMPWLLQSGKTTMSRRVFFASCLVDAARNSTPRVEAASEERLMCFSAVTLRLPSPSCCSMSTRLPLEVFTPLARDLPLSVSPST